MVRAAAAGARARYEVTQARTKQQSTHRLIVARTPLRLPMAIARTHRCWSARAARLCSSVARVLSACVSLRTRICSLGMSFSLLTLLSFFMRLLRMDLPIVKKGEGEEERETAESRRRSGGGLVGEESAQSRVEYAVASGARACHSLSCLRRAVCSSHRGSAQCARRSQTWRAAAVRCVVVVHGVASAATTVLRSARSSLVIPPRWSPSAAPDGRGVQAETDISR